MRARQASCDPSGSPGCRFGAQPSQPRFLLAMLLPPIAILTGVRSPSPRPLPSKPGQLCANPQHPGYFWAGTGRVHCTLVSQRRLSLANPQVQIWFSYLEEKHRKPNPHTAPNGDTPSCIPGASPSRFHSLQVPQRQEIQLRCSETGQMGDRGCQEPTTGWRSPPRESKVSSQERGRLLLALHSWCSGPTNRGDLLSPYFPTIVLLSDYKNNVSPL